MGFCRVSVGFAGVLDPFQQEQTPCPIELCAISRLQMRQAVLCPRRTASAASPLGFTLLGHNGRAHVRGTFVSTAPLRFAFSVFVQLYQLPFETVSMIYITMIAYFFGLVKGEWKIYFRRLLDYVLPACYTILIYEEFSKSRRKLQ